MPRAAILVGIPVIILPCRAVLVSILPELAPIIVVTFIGLIGALIRRPADIRLTGKLSSLLLLVLLILICAFF